MLFLWSHPANNFKFKLYRLNTCTYDIIMEISDSAFALYSHIMNQCPRQTYKLQHTYISSKKKFDGVKRGDTATLI